MQYVYQYTLASIVISFVVFIYFITRNTVTTKTTTAFGFLIISNFLCGISNFISFYTLGHSHSVPLWVNYLVNMVYFINMMAVPVCFLFTIRFVTNNKHTKNSLRNFLLTLPFFIELVIVLTTPFTRLAFYFDENLVYHHGIFYIILMLVSIIYTLSSLAETHLYKESLTKSQRNTIYLYTSASLFCLIVQQIFKQLMLVEFMSSISILLIFISLENPANYKEKEMGILNRKAFQVVVENMLSKKEQFRIIGIQTNGLKHLNETIGIHNKNEFLWQINNTLTHICKNAKLFRISGSRLAIIFEDSDVKEAELLEQIKMAFDSPLRINEFKISISVRMVTMNCPDDVQSVEDCIDLLESSLITLIEADPNTVIRANKEILEKKRRESRILQIMKNAIKNDEFFVVYQPIYSLKEKRFTTAEALVRLESKELGPISPEEFIPIAEKNGMILQIGEFVFESVCQFLVQTKIWEKGIQYIHVNLSVVQCMQEKLYYQLMAIMDSYNLNYDLINLEVTETAAVASSDILMNNMNHLIENRINFSLDDYGTGFSNTASLVKYPFKTVKLDKSMIWQSVSDQKALHILKHIIKMVKSLGMEIVAEGIETEEQAETLKELGCDYIQGFYYSKPIQAPELMVVLKNQQEEK